MCSRRIEEFSRNFPLSFCVCPPRGQLHYNDVREDGFTFSRSRCLWSHNTNGFASRTYTAPSGPSTEKPHRAYRTQQHPFSSSLAAFSCSTPCVLFCCLFRPRQGSARRVAWQVLGRLEMLFRFAWMVNLLLFLKSGKYATPVDRLVRMRMVS